MKIYQVLKVTSEGKYLVGFHHTLKDAIKCAKAVVANADVASAVYQCTSKHKIEKGFFYASIRLLQHQYGIDAEIWKTNICHEQAGS